MTENQNFLPFPDEDLVALWLEGDALYRGRPRLVKSEVKKPLLPESPWVVTRAFIVEGDVYQASARGLTFQEASLACVNNLEESYQRLLKSKRFNGRSLPSSW